MMVLLHLRGILANGAVLAAPRLKEPGDSEHECGHGAPNHSLRRGIGDAVALEELRGEDDCERSGENRQKTLDPKSRAQNILPVRFVALLKQARPQTAVRVTLPAIWPDHTASLFTLDSRAE